MGDIRAEASNVSVTGILSKRMMKSEPQDHHYRDEKEAKGQW